MTGKTHQILGFATGFSYYISQTSLGYNPSTFAGVLIASSIGALVPDIDQPAAKIWSYFPFGKSMGSVVSKFLEHRNLSHSILGLVIFGYLGKIILNHFPGYWGIETNYVFAAFILGYISHVVFDMLTPEGVPLLFPFHLFFGFPPKPIDALRIHTDKWFENAIIFPGLNIYLILTIYIHLHDIKMVLFK